ncbi:MAG: putative DNA modification/repair radical SAM protein [Clostridiales bacterium]|nr:MAG: putative DNA modification/repair radical SAM protein [Clostridiales bacterium]
MTTSEKFKILTEGAKYDVSCSSSGSDRGSKKGKLGMPTQGGCCHSFTADGRCISLLKILLTNNCIYNCRYCVNRSDIDVPRAIFTPDELCNIVIEFYKRNFIEGLFLSSAVFRSPNYTMELLVNVVEKLRTEYNFNGYIHLKGIPGCDQILVDKAAALVDRMSMNIELPSKTGLKMLAPQKDSEQIVTPMRRLSDLYLAQKAGELKKGSVVPAGQTTQMIIGATQDTDGKIIRLSERLYRGLSMKRVYYSAYVPLGDEKYIPIKPPNLIRENRLYQADWLLRFYGFEAKELIPEELDLPLDIDPKSAWAIRNLDKFPVEINKADYETLLRVPGLGVKSVNRIVAARKSTNLSYEDLKKMKVVLKRARHFILCNGKFYGSSYNEETLRYSLTTPEFVRAPPEQLTLFNTQNESMLNEKSTLPLLAAPELILSANLGEL